jgi:hypothetical protein
MDTLFVGTFVVGITILVFRGHPEIDLVAFFGRLLWPIFRIWAIVSAIWFVWSYAAWILYRGRTHQRTKKVVSGVSKRLPWQISVKKRKKPAPKQVKKETKPATKPLDLDAAKVEAMLMGVRRDAVIIRDGDLFTIALPDGKVVKFDCKTGKITESGAKVVRAAKVVRSNVPEEPEWLAAQYERS